MKQTVRYYRLSDNSFQTRGFAWAYSVRPRSELVHVHCPECGAAGSYPSGSFDVAVEGGKNYPDILGCGAYPFLIVSERVIEVWRAANISSYHTYPVGIYEVKSKPLAQIVPPNYFRVEIDGRSRIDLVASGVHVVRVCPRCGRVIERATYPYAPKYEMVPQSWDGTPLFRDVTTYPRVSFCTEVVMVLSKRHRISNVLFEIMGDLGIAGSMSKSASLEDE